MNRFSGGRAVHRLAFLTSAILILAAPFHAGAAVTTIYQDTLARNSFNNLGTTPPNTIDTGGADWTTTDGSGNVQNYLFYGSSNNTATISAQYGATAVLPLTLSSATTYTVTVNLQNAGGTSDFNQLGLRLTTGSGATLSPVLSLDTTGSGFVYTIEGTGNTFATYSGVGNAGTAANWSFTLDSATGTAMFFYNGTLFLTETNALTPTQMSSISGVGIYAGDGGVTSTYQNFLVTSTPDLAPEPPVTILLLLGGVALGWCYRRRILPAAK